jgi:hypothetical protein
LYPSDIAREKVGQNLRDSLSNQYRSSTKAKRIRREITSAEISIGMDKLIRSNLFVSSRIHWLADTVKEKLGKPMPQLYISKIFTQTNIDILEALKKDKDLTHQFILIEKSQNIPSNHTGSNL